MTTSGGEAWFCAEICDVCAVFARRFTDIELRIEETIDCGGGLGDKPQELARAAAEVRNPQEEFRQTAMVYSHHKQKSAEHRLDWGVAWGLDQENEAAVAS